MVGPSAVEAARRLCEGSGECCGGLAGETYCGWLFIRYLWVSDSLRGQGIGRKLMAGGEERALERGCHSAWVDTFGFQAPGFYQKLGYEVFGELDWSPEHKRFFLQKRLAPRPEASGVRG